ncbi:hypothetical protein B7P43_G05104 [Cryptotermes secundus]|uniref:Uncharacterized protein n=1 Tax=Cryptotermes secundus TaxID=105785 RepID=A0A2J7PXZ0_9NEOP|nr:hypothetical protein B7P43_G05104 [Cryptotermes secundus]
MFSMRLYSRKEKVTSKQATLTDGLLTKKQSHLSKQRFLAKEKLTLDRQIDAFREERKSDLLRQTQRCGQSCLKEGVRSPYTGTDQY